ncbi:unnamed protein product [Rotaria magnacalcarata]|uniref:Uncharacterized protein n=1 Tax=Rotaria magnacalcarata TaxID=392030 RepID=A0A820TT40_9BILA|nr:unnamed protein product [Rotaria magnacalcarata]CAF4471504.1 unnamed protein product [Rotaria magnacalcarata]
MRNLSLNGSPFCSETMIGNQCLWQHRGLSEWVMLIHAPDNFLNDFAGAPTLRKYLEAIKNTTSLTLLTTLAFGHPNQSIPQQHSSRLFQGILTRECQPIYTGRHLPIANSRKVMMLFVHVALEPFHDILVAVNKCPTQVNHYITMFRVRSIHNKTPTDNMLCKDQTLHEKNISYLPLFN